jgi:hypothetical protein
MERRRLAQMALNFYLPFPFSPMKNAEFPDMNPYQDSEPDALIASEMVATVVLEELLAAVQRTHDSTPEDPHYDRSINLKIGIPGDSGSLSNSDEIRKFVSLQKQNNCLKEVLTEVARMRSEIHAHALSAA